MNNQEKMSANETIAEIAKNNMDLWLKTLKTNDPKKMAEFYSADATFLPTVSGELKRGETGAENYFEHFLAKNPEGTVVEDVIKPLAEDKYLHCGMYDFKLDDGNERKLVNARFDYIWQKTGGEWKIIHHHSSVRP